MRGAGRKQERKQDPSADRLQRSSATKTVMDLLGMSTPCVQWLWLRRPTADSAGRGVHVRSMSVPAMPCLQEDSETADDEVRGSQQDYVDLRRMWNV